MGKVQKSRGSRRGMRLTVELGSQVMIEFEGVEERFKSILVGMEAQAYLIIRVLSGAGVEGQVRKGNRVIAGYVSLGTVYGFQSTVLGHIDEPFPLLFLTYPDAVEIKDLRDKPRVRSHIPATAEVSEREFKGLVLDISTSGCRFSTKTLPAKDPVQTSMGDEIALSLALLGVETQRSLCGKVRMLNQDREMTTIGVEFGELDSETESSLESYIQSVLDYHGHQPL